MASGHSKNMFTQNLKFLTPPPFFVLVFSLLPLHVPPPFQCTFTLLTYHPNQKKFRNAYEFSNEKLMSENREKN